MPMPLLIVSLIGVAVYAIYAVRSMVRWRRNWAPIGIRGGMLTTALCILVVATIGRIGWYGHTQLPIGRGAWMAGAYITTGLYDLIMVYHAAWGIQSTKLRIIVPILLIALAPAGIIFYLAATGAR